MSPGPIPCLRPRPLTVLEGPADNGERVGSRAVVREARNFDCVVSKLVEALQPEFRYQGRRV